MEPTVKEKIDLLEALKINGLEESHSNVSRDIVISAIRDVQKEIPQDTEWITSTPEDCDRDEWEDVFIAQTCEEGLTSEMCKLTPGQASEIVRRIDKHARRAPGYHVNNASALKNVCLG